MSNAMYETPDGEHCLYKIGRCIVNGAKIGLFLGFYDAVAVKQLNGKGLIRFCGRVGYIAATPISMMAIFATGTCLASHVRGKNDAVNHFFGGWATSTIITLHAHPAFSFLWAGPILGLIACSCKSLKDQGHDFMWDNRSLVMRRDQFMANNDQVGFRLRKIREEPTDY